MTCVDCSVTFYGDDYDGHITCISEAEKYEKSLYTAKKGKANPQDSWNAVIEQAIGNVKTAPAEVQSFVLKLQDFSNIPRNKAKFANFCKNSLRLMQEKLIEKIWDFIGSFRTDATTAASLVPASNEDVVASNFHGAAIEMSERKRRCESASEEVATGLALTSSEGEDRNEEKHSKKKKKKMAKLSVEESPVLIATPEAEAAPGGEVQEQESKKKEKKDKRKAKKEKKSMEESLG